MSATLAIHGVQAEPISNREIEALMQENVRVIWYFRNRLRWAWLAFGGTQDMLQELRVFMVEAIRKWHEEGRYCKLSNYLFRGMKQAYQQANRCRLIRTRADGGSAALNKLKERARDVRYLGENASKLLDREQEDFSWVQQYVDELPARERLAVAMRFGVGDNDACILDQIGRRLGVSKERARQLVQRGLEMLREIMAKDGIDRCN